MACDLEAARITSLPGEAFYIADFISEDEEEYLLHKVRPSMPLTLQIFTSFAYLSKLMFYLADTSVPPPPTLYIYILHQLTFDRR